MAQASVNLAKNRKEIPVDKESSTSSEQEDIDFKSLEDELYDQEISHILTKKNGEPRKASGGNDALNTPELDIDKMGSYKNTKGSEEETEIDNLSSVDDETSQSANSQSLGYVSNSEDEKSSYGVDNKENRRYENNESQNREKDDEAKSDADNNLDNAEDVEKECNGSSDDESDRETNASEETDDEKNYKNKKQEQSMDDESRDSYMLKKEERMYDSISEDSLDSVSHNQREVSKKNTTLSAMFEPVTDEEENNDKINKKDNFDEKYSKNDEKERNKNASAADMDGKIDDNSSMEIDEENNGIDDKIDEASSLIVSEVFSLKDINHSENDSVNGSGLYTENKEKDCIENTESFITQDATDDEKDEEKMKKDIITSQTKSRRKSKNIVRKELSQFSDELISERDIKEEPLDYDEYNSEGLKDQSTQFHQSMEEEFEYVDGSVASFGERSFSDHNYEILQEGPSVIYRCKLCSCKFDTYQRLDYHMMKHHSKMYSCKYCGEKFERSQILAIHVRINHVLDSFKSKKSHSSDGKIRKISIAEKKRKIAAARMERLDDDYCPDSSYEPGKRSIAHTYVNSEGKRVNKVKSRKKVSSSVVIDGVTMYSCAYCEMLFEKQQQMACHVRNVHILEKNERNCLVYKKCKQNKEKRKHSAIESEDLDYALNDDGDLEVKKLKLSSDTEDTKPSDSTAKSKKRTTRVSNSDEQDDTLAKLQEEFKIQIDSKIFTCPHCPKWYFRKNDLDLHIQRHIRNNFEDIKGKMEEQSEEYADGMEDYEDSFRPVSFCKYCPSKFESVNKLKIHIVRHLGEIEVTDDVMKKKFICRVCNEGTNDSKSMRSHLLIHFDTEIKSMDPHSLSDCKYCGLPFLSEDRQLLHEKAHLDFIKMKQEKTKKKKESKIEAKNIIVSDNAKSCGNTGSPRSLLKGISLLKPFKKKQEEVPSKEVNESKLLTNEKPSVKTAEDQIKNANEEFRNKQQQSDSSSEKKTSATVPVSQKIDGFNSNSIDSIDSKTRDDNDSKSINGKKSVDKQDEITCGDKQDEITSDKQDEILLVKKMFESIPFECGMCKSRFPTSQYLLHHITLHMKGKYVFKVDQDENKDNSTEKGNLTPVSSQPQFAAASPALKQVTVPQSSKQITIIPQPKFIRNPCTSLLKPVHQLPINQMMKSPSFVSTNNIQLHNTGSVLMQNIVTSAPNNIIIPKLPFVTPAVSQKSVRPQFTGTRPIILAQNSKSKPFYFLSNTKQCTTKVTPGQPVSSPQLIYYPTLQKGAPFPEKNTMISIINPKPSSKSPHQTTSLLHTPSKTDPALQQNSVLRSLINTKVHSTKKADHKDDLPSIESDEDMMNCSSPDSVLGVDSDLDTEKNEGMDGEITQASTDLQSSKNYITEKRKSNGTNKNTTYICRKQTVDRVRKKYAQNRIKYMPKSKHHFKKKIKFSDGQWYECPLCMSQFHKLEDFNTHMSTHKSIKKSKLHTCKICGKQFLTKFHIEKHKAQHRKNEYQCSVCDASFETSFGIVQHMTDSHT